MTEKLLLVSMVDADLSNIDYESVKKEWELYKKKGILTKISSALFLYLSSKNYTIMSRLINYEKLRLMKKVNIETYQELVGESERDKEYILLKELIKRFNLDKYITVTREIIYVNQTTVTTITMSIETAVILSIIDTIKNTNDEIRIKNGIVKIIPSNKVTMLKFVLNIYATMLQQLITQYRNLIHKKYYNPIFEKIAEEENVYEYKMKQLPPCISKALDGDIPEGHRNNVIFSLINFLKASVLLYGAEYTKDDIKNMVWTANNNMPSPLPEREVRNLIKYHVDEHFYKIYGWCSKMKEAGLCTEKSFSTCLRKYFTKKQKAKTSKKSK